MSSLLQTQTKTTDLETKEDMLTFLSDDNKKLLGSGTIFDKLCIHVGIWTPKDCNDNPKSLFIFGDNDVKKGLGGQATIRNCKNAIGIPTKKLPSNHKKSFYTDSEYSDNCKKIQGAINAILNKSREYDELIFPKNGFGTGLSQLPQRSPKTYKYLNEIIHECFGIDYDSISKNGLQIEMTPNNQDK